MGDKLSGGIFGSVEIMLYLCYGALHFPHPYTLGQVGVYSPSPEVRGPPVNNHSRVAHNKVKEFFFNTQGVGDFFIRNIIRIFVLMLWSLGDWFGILPSLIPP